MKFNRYLSFKKVEVLLWDFLSIWILIRSSDIVVIEVSTLGISFSWNFLADLRMFSGLLECSKTSEFKNCLILHISSFIFLKKVPQYFSRSSNTATNFCTFWLATLHLVYHFWWEWVISLCLGGDNKNLSEVLSGGTINVYFQFFGLIMHFPVIWTP